MYRILNPDLAYVSLENLEFTVERDPETPGVWGILTARDDAPDASTMLGAFLSIRQVRHGGYTVWSTAGGGRLLGYSNTPIDACTEILRHL